MKQKINNIISLISNIALLLGAVLVVVWVVLVLLAATIGALIWVWYAVSSGLFWLVIAGTVSLLVGIGGMSLTPEELFHNEKFDKTV